MSLNSFLRPEIKKVVAPCIIVIVYLILINSFYFSGDFYNKVGCEFAGYMEKASLYLIENNTAEFENTVYEFKDKYSSYLTDSWVNTKRIEIIGFVEDNNLGGNFLIDPLKTFKKDFFNKQTYECGKVYSILPHNETYSPISIPLVILNILLVALIWYLISCLAIYPFESKMIVIKKNNKKHKK